MTVKELCEALNKVPDDYKVRMPIREQIGEVANVIVSYSLNEVILYTD